MSIISKKMAKMLNEQIVHELYSSNAYLAIASYMNSLGLTVLSKRFFIQSDEERMHALKFIRYMLDVGAPVQIGAVKEAANTFKSVEAAIELALKQEEWVTELINNLMAQAHGDKDYATASFLKWFIDEQVEEIATTGELLQLVRLAGEERILMVEERLMRMGITPDATSAPQ